MTGTSDKPCSVDRDLLLDYMEQGFLDNIVDLMRHQPECIPYVLDMLIDERLRVRLGATVVVEELILTHPEHLIALIPKIAGLMEDENPVIRGDSAYILGMLKSKDALPYLEGHRSENNPIVLEIIQEAIEEIRTHNPSD